MSYKKTVIYRAIDHSFLFYVYSGEITCHVRIQIDTRGVIFSSSEDCLNSLPTSGRWCIVWKC